MKFTHDDEYRPSLNQRGQLIDALRQVLEMYDANRSVEWELTFVGMSADGLTKGVAGGQRFASSPKER
jgi:hypothetical protein